MTITLIIYIKRIQIFMNSQFSFRLIKVKFLLFYQDFISTFNMIYYVLNFSILSFADTFKDSYSGKNKIYIFMILYLSFSIIKSTVKIFSRRRIYGILKWFLFTVAFSFRAYQILKHCPIKKKRQKKIYMQQLCLKYVSNP